MPLLAGKGGELLVSTLGKIQDGTVSRPAFLHSLIPSIDCFMETGEIDPSTGRRSLRPSSEDQTEYRKGELQGTKCATDCSSLERDRISSEPHYSKVCGCWDGC
jgi:hypothetical protein